MVAPFHLVLAYCGKLRKETGVRTLKSLGVGIKASSLERWILVFHILEHPYICS